MAYPHFSRLITAYFGVTPNIILRNGVTPKFTCVTPKNDLKARKKTSKADASYPIE